MLILRPSSTQTKEFYKYPSEWTHYGKKRLNRLHPMNLHNFSISHLIQMGKIDVRLFIFSWKNIKFNATIIFFKINIYPKSKPHKKNINSFRQGPRTKTTSITRIFLNKINRLPTGNLQNSLPLQQLQELNIKAGQKLLMKMCCPSPKEASCEASHVTKWRKVFCRRVLRKSSQLSEEATRSIPNEDNSHDFQVETLELPHNCPFFDFSFISE